MKSQMEIWIHRKERRERIDTCVHMHTCHRCVHTLKYVYHIKMWVMHVTFIYDCLYMTSLCFLFLKDTEVFQLWWYQHEQVHEHPTHAHSHTLTLMHPHTHTCTYTQRHAHMQAQRKHIEMCQNQPFKFRELTKGKWAEKSPLWEAAEHWPCAKATTHNCRDRRISRCRTHKKNG